MHNFTEFFLLPRIIRCCSFACHAEVLFPLASHFMQNAWGLCFMGLHSASMCPEWSSHPLVCTPSILAIIIFNAFPKFTDGPGAGWAGGGSVCVCVCTRVLKLTYFTVSPYLLLLTIFSKFTRFSQFRPFFPLFLRNVPHFIHGVVLHVYVCVYEVYIYVICVIVCVCVLVYDTYRLSTWPAHFRNVRSCKYVFIRNSFCISEKL